MKTGRRSSILVSLVLAGTSLSAGVAAAQEIPDVPDGQTAAAPAGQVGQRQTREQTAPNARPMARIGNRIDSRVQTRLQNRIDRFYNPSTDAASYLASASEQARIADRRRGR